MENEESQTVNKLIKILGDGVNILNLQIEDIENIGRNGYSTDENEENKRSHLLVIKRRSLKLFKDIVEFLVEKLKTERQEFFIFYLPQVRILIDIYSYLQYLTNLHEDDQLILSVTNNLFTLSSAVRGATSDYSDIQQQYTENKKLFQPFFDEYKIEIPEKVQELTKGVMDRQKLTVVSVEQRLNVDDIKNDCPLTTDIWKKVPETIYEFYRKFSLYTHGNPLMNDPRGNEKIWLLSECLVITSLMIELTNSKIIGNKRVDEHKKFLYWLKKEMPKFVKYWATKKLKNKLDK